MKRKFTLFALFAALGGMFLVSCGKKSETTPDQRDSTYTNVNHPDWSRNAVIYEVNLRQYTDSGTITAFAGQLPRLKELGVDILWFMPVHPISVDGRKGTLGSYYAVQDYKAFNPEFGTIDQFKETVRKAHDLGMKVIIDWVPNHSGRDNAWVAEHPDWYAKDADGNMYGPYDWTDVYKFDYSNPDMRAAMIDALKFWVKDIDIDGYRCDVAGEVPVDFWDEARPALDSIKPVFMLAEASMPALHNNAFDMGYNWPLSEVMKAVSATAGQYTFKDAQGNVREFPETHAMAIDSLLNAQAVDYPKDTYLMNMITNHDYNSWEGTEFDRYGNLVPAMAVMTYTIPGMPLLYTGQETGMNRALEFFEKDKAPEWEPRNDYFTFYQKLNHLKHTQPALAAGTEGAPMVVYATTSPDLYVYSREKDGHGVVVLLNLSNADQTVEFTDTTPDVAGMKDYFTTADAALPATMTPGQHLLFVK